MSRKTAWRFKVSHTVSVHQDQALSSETISLLRSNGPTAFLLQETRPSKSLQIRVLLGDPHMCTCPAFTHENEICKHICWVLLRLFRIPREHAYSFQGGLVEREIWEMLHRTQCDVSPASVVPSRLVQLQKTIQDQDACPICHKDLLEIKQPVSYCRFGCGSNIHISCMKVWADHQKSEVNWDMVKCPLCRQDFSSLKLLKKQVKNSEKLFTAAEKEKANVHLGVICHRCRRRPVTGRCFKCAVCKYLYLCEDCKKKGCHPLHPFLSKAKRSEEWRLVDDVLSGPNRTTSQPELSRIVAAGTKPLPEDMLNHLSEVTVSLGSSLVEEGMQCRICLQSFRQSQRVWILPCHHKFHVDCVDQILLKTNSCPLDGYVIHCPLTGRTSASQSYHRTRQKRKRPVCPRSCPPGLEN